MSTDARNIRITIFRERLDELRGQISYADFAAFLGISRATIGFYLAVEARTQCRRFEEDRGRMPRFRPTGWLVWMPRNA